MTRVLVVDDDPLVCRTIRLCLDAWSFETVAADGARAGIQALRQTTFDIMVIDIFMPEMDGLGSIRTFHQLAPDVPMIAISGHHFPEHHGPAPDFLGMSVHLGATRFLRKPFKPQELLEAIQQCLKKRAKVEHALNTGLAGTTAAMRSAHKGIGN